MTRKDYELIANVIASVNNFHLKGHIEADQIVPEIAKGLASELKVDNGRFDRDRFLTACGVTE